MFSLDNFISNHITNRPQSLFQQDILENKELLQEAINNKSVIVIGGAGTIGSSYIKSLLRFCPKRLFVIDTSENGLTELTRDLRSDSKYNIPDVYKTYPINYGGPIFQKVVENEGPFEIIANFAAHKHVRSEKDKYSIEAMLQNNIVYNYNLLELIKDHPVEHFFSVSTDKAANPVNVMGASKKIMEDILLAYSTQVPITTARFANVAFSNGSLLAGFVERMMKKQPLSCPSNVERYFVSPEESGQLCLLASLLGNSGEIIFPRLDGMKNFADIAVAFIKAHGFDPQICATEIEARGRSGTSIVEKGQYPLYLFNSDTSGEKLYEEFYTDFEKVDLNRFNNLGVIVEGQKRSVSEINDFISALDVLFSQPASKFSIISLLSEFIPTFNHLETGISLDQKM